jgi:hypothetical protein
MDPYTYAVTPPSGSSGGVGETEVPILQQIANLLASGVGGGSGSLVVAGTVRAYDYQAFAYFTGTNNVQSITYRSGGAGGTIVAVTRFNYDTPGVDNANVTVIATTTT